MKFETVMLHSLFAACLLVCALTLGAMLTAKTTVSNVAASQAAVAVVASN
ncbi:hypothetical protein SAMN05216570_0284 [Dyella sp. OK004]|nr:hypothetical protein [Dyella sp. OK004]SFR88429.1 hypothetical protein SAMN05216570_0284 [Dyella sp. OK004]